MGDRLTPEAVDNMGSWMIKQHCAGRKTFELRKIAPDVVEHEPLLGGDDHDLVEHGEQHTNDAVEVEQGGWGTRVLFGKKGCIC